MAVIEHSDVIENAVTLGGGGSVSDPLTISAWTGTHAIVDETGSPHLIVGGAVADANPDYAAAVVGNDDPAYALNGLNAYSGSGLGVYAQSSTWTGVVGRSTSRYGVEGNSTSSSGVRGSSDSAAGVAGESTSGIGVTGQSTSAEGVRGTSSSAAGVAGNGTPGVQASSTDGTAALIVEGGPLFVANQTEPATPTGGVVFWSVSGVAHAKGPDGVDHALW